jgi:DNA gyrase/topoisomerase IV subunit A
MELKKNTTYLPIEDDINVGLRDFALYTIYNRAIPSAIDGLKPTQRKILYAMLQYPSPTKNKVKVADLGSVSRYNYHHAESAAQQTAVGMAQAWANNVPLFTGIGNFGSRKVPSAASPRYIYATLSNEFTKYFCDFDVCPSAIDPDDPEPQFYLPIIPWVLVNGVSGVATGFATKILPRDPALLSKLTKKVVKNPNATLGIVPPSFPDFKGVVDHVEGNTWKVKGIIDEAGPFGFVIREVPYGEDRAGYITILNDLCDKNIINDYDDQCSGDGFKFSIKCSKAQKEEILANNPMKVFKLEKQYTENLTMIGHDNKIKVFDTVEDVIKYFVSYRLTAFERGIEFDRNSISSKLSELKDKVRFIKDFINGKFNITKMKKSDLVQYIETNITGEEYGKSFVSIPVYNLTTDAIEAYENSIESLEEELIVLNEVTPSSRFLEKLK